MESEQQIEMTVQADSLSVKVKTPKRILHFSDGTLEEYSDDDDEVNENEMSKKQVKQDESVVDPKSLTWGPWMLYMMWAAGNSTVSACDYVGESLAYMFGITTPKYYFEIEEFKRREAAKMKLEERSAGWSETPDDDAKLVTKEFKTTTTASVTPISNTSATITMANV